MRRPWIDPTTRCRWCWIGGSAALLGGASFPFFGLDALDLTLILLWLGIYALIGLTLSLKFCPARADQHGRSGGYVSSGGAGDGSPGGCRASDGDGCGDGGGGDGGGE